MWGKEKKSWAYNFYENTVGKEENAQKELFSFSTAPFTLYSSCENDVGRGEIQELTTIFIKFVIVICKFFQFGRI